MVASGGQGPISTEVVVCRLGRGCSSVLACGIECISGPTKQAASPLGTLLSVPQAAVDSGTALLGDLARGESKVDGKENLAME